MIGAYQNQTHQIQNLLEKMTSNDKDFRFMATNDLMTELQKDSIKLDDESEKKVVRMVLRLLEDKNGEVQNLAVKCLGPLVNKVKENQVETIVDSLCGNMIASDEQLRDISSIGLKTVISELPQTSNSLVPNVCQRIIGKLSTAIEKEDVSVQLEALDILIDLLSRFGDFIIPFHDIILKALLPQLGSDRQAVRKRTIVAISLLMINTNSTAYNKVTFHLLEGLEKPVNPGTTRTYIQCLSAICRQSGHRLYSHLHRIMNMLKQYSYCEDDELREFCLQACEAFVYRCPDSIDQYIPMIIDLCLYYMVYDPNYNYEADDLEGNATMDTEDDDEDNSDEYSDDDDVSWKVRRSAAKCLEAVISTRTELIEEFYTKLSPKMIARFKEREENVKSDIFHAYIALLKATKPHEDVFGQDPNSMEQISGPVGLLQNQVTDIIKAVQPLMKDKSVKTRQDCFLLLRELLNVLPGAYTNHLDSLMPGIQYSLGDKNTTSNMKIDTLAFLCCVLQAHSPQVFHPQIQLIVPLVVNAVFDPFYKIATEALQVLQQLVKVIRPIDKPLADISQFDFRPLVEQLYNCTLQKLKSSEVDQEVKERAIACMGQIIANMGDCLNQELYNCLPLFLERMKNEVTRLSSVKAVTMIATSPIQIDFSPIMHEMIPLLGSFLRKNQRALKMNSLILLDALVCNYVSLVDPALLHKAILEIPPLLSDTDLHVAQLSLILLTSVCRQQPQAIYGAEENILPFAMNLLKSPLLQGMPLNCTLNLFQALVEAKLPGIGYRELLEMLRSPVRELNLQPHSNAQMLSKQAFHSLGKCIAAITLQVPNQAIPLANELLTDIQRIPNDANIVFCLLSIGEIGRYFDLSSIADLPTCIMGCFSTQSEDVKAAASHALGAIAVGNLSHYLPFILNGIEENPKRQYLLLHSLKEVITSLANTSNGLNGLLPSVPAIWEKLFKNCECSEEGSRNVIAECLGKLVLVNPEDLLPRLQQALHSESPLMRTAVVSAIKFTISDQPQPIDPMLRQSIGQFLSALQDPVPSVRRVALVAFNSAVHNKPILVRDLLPDLLPRLYLETKVKKELIREVEMGPFKHTVDDGLDIRKAAFECMYTLLEQGLDRVDVMEFLEYVQAGLRDHYDIKMLTYLMTARLALMCPTAVLQRLDQFIDPLRSTCTLKVKANSVKQEYEKQDELKRSALRALSALASIPKATKNQQLSEFLKYIRETPDLKQIYDSVKKDSTLTTNGGDNNAMDQS